MIATATAAHHVSAAHALIRLHRGAAVRILTEGKTSEAENG
jgi:hypothetical protein